MKATKLYNKRKKDLNKLIKDLDVWYLTSNYSLILMILNLY